MRNTANAYQYEYEDNEAFVLVVKPVQENVVLREIKLKRARKKVKNRILIKVACLIALGLLVALRYASITEINYKNQALQAQQDMLQAEVQRKQVEIDSRMSITEISRIAQEKLNMHKPQAYQIVHYKAEAIDQTEMRTGDYTQDTQTKPWYERAWDSVLEFLGLIDA